MRKKDEQLETAVSSLTSPTWQDHDSVCFLITKLREEKGEWVRVVLKKKEERRAWKTKGKIQEVKRRKRDKEGVKVEEEEEEENFGVKVVEEH